MEKDRIRIGTLQFAIRLLLAIALGATIGLERQWRQRMAGTRTNALVAAGAAAFVMCGLPLDNDPSACGREKLRFSRYAGSSHLKLIEKASFANLNRDCRD